MLVFISGGAKNGKTDLAEDLAALQKLEQGRLCYIATMKAADDEDNRRIENHRNSRKDKNFTTVEIPFNLLEGLATMATSEDSLLLDSLTAILGNEMFMTDGGYKADIAEKLMAELEEIYDKYKNLVVVSDFIYSSVFAYDEISENYRGSLADLDKLTAAKADIVLELSAGQIICHKGKEEYSELSKRLSSLPWNV